MDKYFRPCLAELIGTFALVFISAGTICSTQLALGPGQASPAIVALSVALATGLIYASVLSATLPISGGFLNPAVTLMLWVFRRLEGAAAGWLIGAQVIGATLAGLILYLMFTPEVLFPSLPGSVGITPHLNRDAFQTGGTPLLPALWSGIGIEFALTFLLTFAIYGTVLDPRATRLGGLGLGLATSALTLMGFLLTGAALNPVRWFGPALWELTVPGNHAFVDHMVYWIGPVFGALTGGGVYEYLVLASGTGEAEESVEIVAPVTSTLYRKK
jgi:glycerol uptake facilitator-like aquaporin